MCQFVLEHGQPVARTGVGTADPLHNKHATMRAIAEKGGGYLIGTAASTSRRTSH